MNYLMLCMLAVTLVRQDNDLIFATQFRIYVTKLIKAVLHKTARSTFKYFLISCSGGELEIYKFIIPGIY